MIRPSLFLLLFLLVPVSSFASTIYSGEETLLADTVWEGEVTVDGILTVAPGVTLEIRPGTVIRFTPFDSNGDGVGEHEIFIQGTLRAMGTESSPILFTSAASEPRPGDWGAINMMASEEGNRLEGCLVEYAYRGFHAHFSKARIERSVFRRNLRAIQFQESDVDLDSCRLEGNRNGMQFRNSTVTITNTTVSGSYWGVRAVYSDVAMERCRIEGNLVNGVNLRDSTFRVIECEIVDNRKGLYLQRSTGDLLGSLLSDNDEYGILLENSGGYARENLLSGNGRGGIKWVDSSTVLRQNDFDSNGEYALVNDGSTPADASGNWWGTISMDLIASMIRDGLDRPGLGLVDAKAPLAGPAYKGTSSPFNQE